jgi:pilus assembly protein CpaB
MSLRAIATLVIAVVLGLAAVLIVNGLLNSKPKVPPAAVVAAAPTTPVIVAAKPITRGEVVTPDLLKVVSFPQGSAPEGAFSDANTVTADKAGPRVAMRDLGVGEPVLQSRLTPPGGKLNMSGIIASGMQAVTLHTNAFAGVAGFILPGDHVDVLMTRTTTPPRGGPATTVVQVVLENVKVVAIDQNANDESNGAQVGGALTVEVTPEQAQTLTLAQTIGSVSFSLRHALDSSRLTRIATAAPALDLAHPRPAKPPPPVEDYGLVRVTRTTDTTVYQLSSR